MWLIHQCRFGSNRQTPEIPVPTNSACRPRLDNRSLYSWAVSSMLFRPHRHRSSGTHPRLCQRVASCPLSDIVIIISVTYNLSNGRKHGTCASDELLWPLLGFGVFLKWHNQDGFCPLKVAYSCVPRHSARRGDNPSLTAC